MDLRHRLRPLLLSHLGISTIVLGQLNDAEKLRHRCLLQIGNILRTGLHLLAHPTVPTNDTTTILVLMLLQYQYNLHHLPTTIHALLPRRLRRGLRVLRVNSLPRKVFRSTSLLTTHGTAFGILGNSAEDQNHALLTRTLAVLTTFLLHLFYRRLTQTTIHNLHHNHNLHHLHRNLHLTTPKTRRSLTRKTTTGYTTRRSSTTFSAT